MIKRFESKFAMIYTDGTIRLFDKTEISYKWSDVEAVLKNVHVELNDDHMIYIIGTTAMNCYAADPLYIDTLPEDIKEKLLPVRTYKSLFKKREFIRGCYGVWNDYPTEMYLKFDPYSIVIMP